MIEWRWGLDPFTVRDAGANNLAEALDFTASGLRVKPLSVPEGPFGGLCVPGLPGATDSEWLPLLEMATAFGWPLGAVAAR
jgi:phospholipase C